VAHSVSPAMQNAALAARKIDAQYARFEIHAEELHEALHLIRRHEFIGVNLTIPHKVAALDLLDEIDGNARQVGAVNTVKVENGRLSGFNTDGKGFVRAIHQDFGIDVRNLRVLLLGAGGAARAIAWQCAREHCERLVVANRTLEKATALTHDVRQFFVGPKVLGPVPRLQAIPWEESAFRFQIANSDLVVNATPLGWSGSDASPISARVIEPHLMVYDTIYAQDRPTALVAAAREAGARAADGLSMLVQQGALAFEVWFGREAPIDAMRETL
jgi:shikimate dehydrogenase